MGAALCKVTETKTSGSPKKREQSVEFEGEVCLPELCSSLSACSSSVFTMMREHMLNPPLKVAYYSSFHIVDFSTQAPCSKRALHNFASKNSTDLQSAACMQPQYVASCRKWCLAEPSMRMEGDKKVAARWKKSEEWETWQGASETWEQYPWIMVGMLFFLSPSLTETQIIK